MKIYKSEWSAFALQVKTFRIQNTRMSLMRVKIFLDEYNGTYPH